jgi:hypothetical protein
MSRCYRSWHISRSSLNSYPRDSRESSNLNAAWPDTHIPNKCLVQVGTSNFNRFRSARVKLERPLPDLLRENSRKKAWDEHEIVCAAPPYVTPHKAAIFFQNAYHEAFCFIISKNSELVLIMPDSPSSTHIRGEAGEHGPSRGLHSPITKQQSIPAIIDQRSTSEPLQHSCGGRWPRWVHSGGGA